jgi:hypothetical protein
MMTLLCAKAVELTVSMRAAAASMVLRMDILLFVPSHWENASHVSWFRRRSSEKCRTRQG